MKRESFVLWFILFIFFGGLSLYALNNSKKVRDDYVDTNYIETTFQVVKINKDEASYIVGFYIDEEYLEEEFHSSKTYRLGSFFDAYVNLNNPEEITYDSPMSVINTSKYLLYAYLSLSGLFLIFGLCSLISFVSYKKDMKNKIDFRF